MSSPTRGKSPARSPTRAPAKAGAPAAEEEVKAEPKPRYVPPPSKEELERRRKIRNRRLRKLRLAKEAKQKADEAAEAERRRAAELAEQRWRSCLKFLKDSVPMLKANPWLIVQEATFIHDYLDALAETLQNLAKHGDDLDSVRTVLQDVYEGFVDLGRFAKSQPAFYVTNPHTIKKFVRLLDQVAHRGSDKALFPNVLAMLGPTFEREELFDYLAEARIAHSLMSFCRPPEWVPTPSTITLLLQIVEVLSQSPRLRTQFLEEPGFQRLVLVAWGQVEGPIPYTKEQQTAMQHALRSYPRPVKPAAADDSKSPVAGAAAPPAASSSSSSSITSPLGTSPASSASSPAASAPPAAAAASAAAPGAAAAPAP